MGRAGLAFGLWLFGFVVGTAVYFAQPMLMDYAIQLVPFLIQLNEQIRAALLAGFATSIVTILAIAFAAAGSKGRAK